MLMARPWFICIGIANDAEGSGADQAATGHQSNFIPCRLNSPAFNRLKVETPGMASSSTPEPTAGIAGPRRTARLTRTRLSDIKGKGQPPEELPIELEGERKMNHGVNGQRGWSHGRYRRSLTSTEETATYGKPVRSASPHGDGYRCISPPGQHRWALVERPVPADEKRHPEDHPAEVDLAAATTRNRFEFSRRQMSAVASSNEGTTPSTMDTGSATGDCHCAAVGITGGEPLQEEG